MHRLSCVLIVLTSACGTRGDPLPSCIDYCNRLRTSQSGCGNDVETCQTDCELWIRDNENARCVSQFDRVLSCTDHAPDVCQAVGEECSLEWSAWASCVETCKTPGEVRFSPTCTSSAACKSGSVLTITSDVPLACDVRVIVSCAGGTATGYIPAGDPATASGTVTVSCAQASLCSIQVDSANRYLSGSTGVYCTP